MSAPTPRVADEATGVVDDTKVSAIIFDVDDTLYDVGTGFTAYRRGHGVTAFLMEHLGFSTEEDAMKVQNEYFERYHSTAKGLAQAQADGKLPANAPPFRTADLAHFWATRMSYDLLGGVNPELVQMLRSCPIQHVIIFSNAPRAYVLRVLRELGLLTEDESTSVLSTEKVFAVDDVLPHCKPEPEAFQTILDKMNIPSASQCIMVEDSMKNIQTAKQLGMKTVLVAGRNWSRDADDSDNPPRKRGKDVPNSKDPAVDVTVPIVTDLPKVLPELWNPCHPAFVLSRES